MKKFIIAILITQCISGSILAQNQEKINLWGGLSSGPYKVGYKVASEYDYSRTVSTKFNYQGKLVNDNNYRPVQISIWYPANIVNNNEEMLYEEYIITRGTKFDYSLMTKEGAMQIIDDYKSNWNWYNPSQVKDEKVINSLLSRKTKAVKNAEQQNGKFPLIIFCSGGGDTPSSFDVLFEFLASHGYVVAAISSRGMIDEQPSYNLMDEESQVRDMEFAMSYMRTFTSVDIINICSMGYSYGGLINVLFALRNFDIKSVLCIDGSICLKDRAQYVKNLPYFKPSLLRIPFMNMARKIHDEQDFEFYNNLIYSDAYLLHFNQMSHQDFKSVPNIRDFEDFYSDKNRNLKSIDKNKELVYQYILNFLNTYMKNDANSLSFMQTNLKAKEISKDILQIEFKKSLNVPPTGKNFIEFVKAEGSEKGKQAYLYAKENDPQIIIFNKNEINNLGYEFLNAGFIENAIKVFQLFVMEFPNISNSYDSLGEAYAKNNNIKEAIYNYRKALEINPNSQSAARAIKELEKLQNEKLK